MVMVKGLSICYQLVDSCGLISLSKRLIKFVNKERQMQNIDKQNNEIFHFH